MDVEDLLAGIRGRRMLLGYARRLAERGAGTAAADLTAALFHAELQLLRPAPAPAEPEEGDPAPLGPGEWTRAPGPAGAGADPGGVHGGPSGEPVDAAAAEVALHLDRVDLGVPHDPEGTDLLLALADSVAAARYWQAPDEVDRLCAQPAVRAALARIAAHALAVEPIGWWDAPVHPDAQARVIFDGAPDPDREPAEVLAAWRGEVLADERRNARMRRRRPERGFSGVWWSRPPAALPASTRRLAGGRPAGLDLVEDALDFRRAEVRDLHVPAGARVLEIHGPADWARLCREHPLEVTASRRDDWRAATGRTGTWVLPDWSALARGHDGVHLSVAGYLRCAGEPIEVGDGAASVVAGWGPDETWWFGRPWTGAAEHWGLDVAGVDPVWLRRGEGAPGET